MTKTTEENTDGVAIVRTRYRCRPTYNADNLAAMALLGQAGLDRNIYLAMAMDQLSKISRPRRHLARMLDKYRTQDSSREHLSFSPLLREPGVFTDEAQVVIEDLITHGLVVEGEFNDDQARELASGVPWYGFPGLGGRTLIWTPHVREQLTRLRAARKSIGEARPSFEREYLKTQLARFSGDVSRTAAFVGLETSELSRRLKGALSTVEKPNED